MLIPPLLFGKSGPYQGPSQQIIKSVQIIEVYVSSCPAHEVHVYIRRTKRACVSNTTRSLAHQVKCASTQQQDACAHQAHRVCVHVKRAQRNMHMSATSVHRHLVYNCVGTVNPRFLLVCTSTAPNVDVHIKRAKRMPSAQSARICIKCTKCT